MITRTRIEVYIQLVGPKWTFNCKDGERVTKDSKDIKRAIKLLNKRIRFTIRRLNLITCVKES